MRDRVSLGRFLWSVTPCVSLVLLHGMRYIVEGEGNSYFADDSLGGLDPLGRVEGNV